MSFRLSKLSGFLAVILSLVAILGFGGRVSAVTPPDSCFNFDGINSITEYYDYEGNNPANPACPKDVDIPSTIGGITVTTIGGGAFSNKSITSLTIPSSITTIGSYAFDTNLLTTVAIPDTVTTLGDGVFANNQITSATLPTGLTSISNSLFSNNQLTSVTIPASVTSIGDGAFAQNQLSAIAIPSGVTTIGQGAFYQNRLTSLVIPDSVVSIGEIAFQFNDISSLTLGNSVTTIGTAAFTFNNLTLVNVPNSLTTIDQFAFSGNNPNVSVYDTIMAGGSVSMADYVNGMVYVRLYTADLSNPNNLTGEATLETTPDVGDFNGDGDTNDVVGGYIVNPASIAISYEDGSGNTLQPDQTYVGIGLMDYLSANNGDLSLYYRVGDSKTFVAPAISGYTTPADANLTLSLTSNSYTFVYTSSTSTSSSAASSGTSTSDASTNSGSSSDLASTGSDVSSLLTLVLSLATVSGLVAAMGMKKARG